MERGERKGTGETKLSILEMFLLNPDDDMSVSEVRAKLRKSAPKGQYIEQRRGIKKHLSELHSFGLLNFKGSSYSLSKEYKTIDFWIRLCRGVKANEHLEYRMLKLASLISEEARLTVFSYFSQIRSEKFREEWDKLSKDKIAQRSFDHDIKFYYDSFDNFLIFTTKMKFAAAFYSDLSKFDYPELKAWSQILLDSGKLAVRERADAFRFLIGKRNELYNKLGNEKISSSIRRKFHIIDNLIVEKLKFLGYMSEDGIIKQIEDIPDDEIEEIKQKLFNNPEFIKRTLEIQKNWDTLQKIHKTYQEKLKRTS